MSETSPAPAEPTPPSPAPEPPAPAAPTPAPAAPSAAAAAAPAPAPEGSYLPLLLVLAAAIAAGLAGWALRGDGELVPGSPEAAARAQELLKQGEEQARRPDAGVKTALDALAEAHRLAPDDGRTNLAYGRALSMSTRYAEALPLLLRARDLLPDDGAAHLEAGAALIGVQRPDEARPVLERAHELLPQDPRPLYQLAVAAFVGGDPEAVLRHLDAHAALAPDTPPTLQMRYQAARSLGRLADAVAPLTSLCALAPRDVRLRRERQDLLVQAQGWKGAADEARRAAEAPDADAVSLYLCGRLLAQHPKTAAEAASFHERALAKEPTFAWALAGLGVERMRDGDLEGGRARLLEALKVDPQLFEAAIALARLEEAAGKFDDARAHHERLLTAGYGGARDGVLACLLAVGRVDDALAFAREQAPRDAGPGHPARWLEARALARAGRPDEARAIAAAIGAAAPEADRWRWRGNEGMALLEAGRRDEARAAFDDALGAAPPGVRPSPLLFLWAGVTRAQEDPEGARERWRRGAQSGEEHNPEALFTWSCRRLLGEATLDDVRAAARLGGVDDENDAWFVEGLSLELEGKAAEARAAYEKAKAASRPGELPARLVDAALERLGS